MDKVQESLSELFDSGYRLGQEYGYTKALKEAIIALNALIIKAKESNNELSSL